jgi:hypothetical protein
MRQLALLDDRLGVRDRFDLAWLEHSGSFEVTG